MIRAKTVVTTLAGLAALASLNVPSAAAADYDTPDKLFQALKAAEEKRDFKTIVDALAPASREDLAGGMAYLGLMARGYAEKVGAQLPPEKAAEFTKLTATMAKHGLTEMYLKQFEARYGETPKTRDELARRLTALVEPVKDRTAFLQDMMEAVPAVQIQRSKELKGLKIDGERATAIAVRSRQGRDFEEPLVFVKHGASWRLLLPPIMEELAKNLPKN